jgi:cytoskeletal protein CcmA (bactofilin family)
MSKSRKTAVVDGYSAVKAAQQPEAHKLAGHIGRSVAPTKQVIECYECGYKFQLHGRAAKTNCSKCRVTLDLSDHVIVTKWTTPLRTAGTIHIAPTGVLVSGELVANDIVLEGKIEEACIRAMRRLELGRGATFPERNVSAADLKIAPGAVVDLKQQATYRDVEVLGTLNADLHASGVVTVQAGGRLEGKVHAEHLVVEEGAGLEASVHVEPATKRSRP